MTDTDYQSNYWSINTYEMVEISIGYSRGEGY